jgi:hypothetical protein
METNRHTFSGSLETWRQEMLLRQYLHNNTAERLGKFNYWLGIPVITLSTIVGSSIFAVLEKQVDTLIKIALGFISVTAAVLSALQTFFKFSERAEQHRVAAAGFAALRHEITAKLASPRGPNFDLQSVLEELQKKIEGVVKQAPSLAWPPTTEQIASAQKIVESYVGKNPVKGSDA